MFTALHLNMLLCNINQFHLWQITRIEAVLNHYDNLIYCMLDKYFSLVYLLIS